jgi:vancomycin resistance protein YoaR
VQRLLVLVAFGAFVLLAAGFAFAGSTSRLPSGTHIAGVDVGGETQSEAVATLKAHNRQLEKEPIVLIAAGHRFTIGSDQLGFVPDWNAAVHTALKRGGGPSPLRGYRRLWASVAGLDVAAPGRYWTSVVSYEIARIARVVDHPRRESTLALHGTKPVVVPGVTGHVLDRQDARAQIVGALTSFSRTPVQLIVREDVPRVAASDLRPVAAQVRVALSAPVTLKLGPTSWKIPRWRLAQVIELPHDGTRHLRVGGDAATEWLAALAKRVSRPAQDATWVPAAHGAVRLVAARPGEELDPIRSAGAILRAALSPRLRVAQLQLQLSQPKRSTAAAKAMGITGTVGTYETFYTGIPNRLHNVRLVAHLVDDKLIPPGAVFSFNRTTGDRNAAKGFLEAPVIINGELSTGLGGGVCQVSTTVFNAAYEGGLPIVERHNHALYISHYPQGRDATVNYPDVDLKFRNDSGHWLLLRMTIGDSSLVATLYGTPLHRKVVSDTGALVVSGGPPLKKVKDPTLEKGTTVVDDPGAPSMSTQVERKVYAPGGKLLYDDVFHSYYVASAKVVRVGTKKPEPGKTDTTGTGTTDTGTTGTTSTGTGATTTTAKTKTTPLATTTTATTPPPGTD